MTPATVDPSALPDLATAISVLTGVILPWIVGRVTRITAHPRVRGALLLILSAATSVLTELGQVITSGAAYDPQRVVLGALGTYTLGVVLHLGLYRHLNVYQVNAASGGFIGKPATPKGLP